MWRLKVKLNGGLKAKLPERVCLIMGYAAGVGGAGFGGFTTTGVILVLFILLVIVGRAWI
jgi:uncharacterized protein (TIGR01732 family)